MALEIKLNQKLSQTLVMTPQLQQAIKLLQLGRQEYLEVIEQELLENPTLEDMGEDVENRDKLLSTNSELKAEQKESIAHELDALSATQLNDESEMNSALENSSSSKEHAEEFFDSYESDSMSFSRGNGAISDDGDVRSPIEANFSRPEGLINHILWQLRTTDLPEADFDIAMQIVGNLDRNGYLCSNLEELTNSCERSLEDIERVLQLVQTLDPSGIAARDLKECLYIQLEQLGQTETLAGRLVSNYLHELELHHYDLIARKEGVSIEEVYQAVKLIQSLEPRPGRPFIEEAPIYITPDVYVKKVGDDYIVSLNEKGIPRLRVNPYYKSLLFNGQAANLPEKEYIQGRYRAATWLIKSIEQRQQTIYRVSESIVKFQREFFEKGVSALRPLILRDIAEDVALHESTISRVTTNKYMHTPQGVYELKFFFSSSLRSGNGEVSSESVKDRIKELIANENAKKPFSDQALVNILKAEGVDIARRTVAKYREMLSILPSSRRKKVF